MGSTDESYNNERIRKLFLSELRLISSLMRQEGLSYFPAGFDLVTPSYFIQRSKTRMTKADFESGVISDVKDFATSLRELWCNKGTIDLIPLVSSLTQIAGDLRQAEKQAESISPFMYVMF